MLRRLLAALGIGLLLASVFSCASSSINTSTSAKGSGLLLPAPVDSSEALWGFIDTNGNWVIKPQFQDAYRFHDGLARVELNDKWGYVNESGLLIVPAQYTEAHDFGDGLARVATGPKHDYEQDFRIFLTATGYGYIDTTGNMVIPPTWKDAGDFSESLAAVMQEDTSKDSQTYGEDLCGYIDKTGRVVIPLKLGTASAFSEGLAAVWVDGGWGYIDKTGAWAVKPMPNVGPIGGPLGVPDDDFISAMNLPVRAFQSGFAPVSISTTPPEEEPSPTWYFIDKTGRKTGWGGIFDQAGKFSEGLAPVEDNRSGKWGFIDTGGNMAIAAQFGESPLGAEDYLLTTEGFHQGLAAAAPPDGTIGYIDKTGKWVIPPQFSYANGFADGYAYVKAVASPDRPTSTLQGLEGPAAPPQFGPLEIIDLTGRVIYTAPEASGGGSTTSS